ncbi:MAG: tyrosine-type recombinase/integrase [Gemmatimonas sp.]
MSVRKTNPGNDRLKREYLVYLKDARQRSEATVEQVRHAIDRFEAYNGFKDFGTFNKEQALAFKHQLLGAKGPRSRRQLSKATAHHILRSLREFLIWLHGRPGYRRRVDPMNVAYLNLTTKEEREAHAAKPKPYATFEQYRTALFAMPSGTDLERRDRAVMALLLLTAMRDAAAISLKLKHVDAERGYIFQDPREVRTKFSKAIETVFLPVGDDVAEIFREWVRHLTHDALFGPDDPVFPKTAIAVNADRVFGVAGLSHEHWSTAAPVREIFRTAFGRVNLPYVKPHSVRITLTQLAYQRKLSPEQLKAWSENMGHESVLTTLGSYGPISIERRAEIMAELANPVGRDTNSDLATEVAEKVAAILSSKPEAS